MSEDDQIWGWIRLRLEMWEKYHRLAEDIYQVYQFCQSNPVPKHTPRNHHMPSDPNSELASILAYAQASASYITQADALITQLQTASSGGTDTDSPDVEAAIQAVLAFQTANPVPTAPPAVTAPAPSAS